MKKSFLTLSVFLFVIAQSSLRATGQDSELRDTTDSKYRVGQVWHYKTRSKEPDSFFTVVKVELHPRLGIIVHISVEGLKMTNPRSPDGLSEKITHMPFSEAAIEKSVTRLKKQTERLPKYESGYANWRSAFDAGRAGIYTITVVEAVEVAEKTLNQ
jgi:hypothetical protein